MKVLPKAHLASDECLARFRREAQAAARLVHANIVPVFGVGEQDGVHYYVMQYVEGQGLDSVLTELSQDKETGLLSAVSTKNIDFSKFGGLWVPCAGSVTPWNTHLGSEEYRSLWA